MLSADTSNASIEFAYFPIHYAPCDYARYVVAEGCVSLLHSLMDIIVFNYFIIRFCDFASLFLDRKLTIMIKKRKIKDTTHMRGFILFARSILMGAHTVNRQGIKSLKNISLSRRRRWKER